MRQDDHLSALQPGARLHSYTIGAILGAGGFGITYKAREDITNREVAIKEYLPTAFAVRDRDGATVRPLSEGAAQDFAWGLERFRQEAKLLIGFRHTNIVPVLAYFEANGTGYLVMAFQDGTSLAEILRGALTLSEAETLRIMVPLLDGVEEVHCNEFLHRDIKPENIFVRRDGTPVLLDFGAARQALGEHSKNFTTLLTEGYAPFEQYAGTGNQGPWSDIYALAAVMFRCLAGKVPVEAPRRAVAKLRGNPDPMAPDFAALRSCVSSDLAFAVEAALRVVEHERPQTVAAFRELIISPAPQTVRMPAQASAPHPSVATLIPDSAHRVTVRHPPPWHVAERRKPRRTARYLAFGAVILAAASGAAYVGDQRSWLPEAFRRAGPEATTPITAQAPATADDPRQRAEDARKRTEARALAERRDKALSEYQRQLLEQIEAERRQFFEARRAAEERKRLEEEAAKGEAERKRLDDERQRQAAQERAHAEAERKRQEEEQARRDRFVTRPPANQSPRRGFDSWPPETPETRRETAPAVPPSARRPPTLGPGDAQRYSPYPPPARGQAPRGWRDPNAVEDY